MGQDYRFRSLEEAVAALQQIRDARVVKVGGPVSLYQALSHIAQSIDCSRTGYPQMKPGWVRATIGWLVLRVFLLLGSMRHNLADPVPGAPAIPPEGDTQGAWDRLLAAIADFQAHKGPTADHFFYGPVDKATYDRVHAMHIADHLSAVTIP